MKITLQICNLIAQEKGGRCLSNDYINAKTKMQWICKYDHIWEATFDKIRQGRWCHKCSIVSSANKKRKTIDKYINDLFKVHGNQIKLCPENQTYRNTNIPLFHMCGICNSNFKSQPKHLLAGHGCPYCSGNKVNNTNSLATRYPEIAQMWHPYKNYNMTPDLVFNGCKKKFWWQCDKGHEYMQAVFKKTHYSHDCPYCHNQISKAQEEIHFYLSSIYEHKIILNEENIIKPFDLDIYIPSLKLAIEYDGEYWHYSDWAIENGSIDRMNKKDGICNEKNIKLLRIRERKWLSNKEKVLQDLIDFIDLSLK